MGNKYLMSFLDLLSCTLGSVVLLVVIFSLIKNPKITPDYPEFIMGKVVVEGEGEMGVMVTTPRKRSFSF